MIDNYNKNNLLLTNIDVSCNLLDVFTPIVSGSNIVAEIEYLKIDEYECNLESVRRGYYNNNKKAFEIDGVLLKTVPEYRTKLYDRC